MIIWFKTNIIETNLSLKSLLKNQVIVAILNASFLGVFCGSILNWMEILRLNHPFLLLLRLQDRNMQSNTIHISQNWEQFLFAGPDYGSELVGCSVSMEVHFYE